MNGRGRRQKRRQSDGFIPPAMMVLMIFVAVFAILLMVVAIARGKEDQKANSETVSKIEIEETVQLKQTNE